MNGAREYANLFGELEQHGRLLIISGKHARGSYFHIWVMPEGGTPTHYGNAPDGSVEVYGILGGHPGWTEYYGWLHSGQWQKDFATLVEKRRAEIAERKNQRAKYDAKVEAERQSRITDTLSTYVALVQK